PTFVTEAPTHGDVHLAGVQKLNLTLAPLFFTVGDDPNVSTDAGVVEHLFRQGDDRLQPVVPDDPFADIALARARTSSEERRATEDDSEARAVLVFLRLYGLEFVDHV